MRGALARVVRLHQRLSAPRPRNRTGRSGPLQLNAKSVSRTEDENQSENESAAFPSWAVWLTWWQSFFSEAALGSLLSEKLLPPQTRAGVKRLPHRDERESTMCAQSRSESPPLTAAEDGCSASRRYRVAEIRR